MLGVPGQVNVFMLTVFGYSGTNVGHNIPQDQIKVLLYCTSSRACVVISPSVEYDFHCPSFSSISSVWSIRCLHLLDGCPLVQYEVNTNLCGPSESGDAEVQYSGGSVIADF